MFSLISVSLLVSKTNGNELEKKKKISTQCSYTFQSSDYLLQSCGF